MDFDVLHTRPEILVDADTTDNDNKTSFVIHLKRNGRRSGADNFLHANSGQTETHQESEDELEVPDNLSITRRLSAVFEAIEEENKDKADYSDTDEGSSLMGGSYENQTEGRYDFL